MRILIDIGHPAHVHYFKHLAKHFLNLGSEVLFTCREKEFEIELLKYYGFNYKSFGRKYKSTFGKILGMIKFDTQEFITGFKFKPDVLLSAGSIYAAHASFLLNKPHIAIEDTGNMEQIRLYLPFTETLLTPASLKNNFGEKQIRYNGCHELAYLHPDRFSANPLVLSKIGLNEGDTFSIVRFISWNASHDLKKSGLTDNEKKELCSKLSKKTKVFITSEGQLPSELEKYRLKIPPQFLHDLLYYASLHVGEGGTTANEAAMLGTPNVLINPQAKNVEFHQSLMKKYQLQYSYDNYDSAIDKITELIDNDFSKNEIQIRKQIYLRDSIDVTGFFIDFIEKKLTTIGG